MAELREGRSDATSRIRRPEKMDAAMRELEGGREEIRLRLGVLDLSVELTDRDEWILGRAGDPCSENEREIHA